MKRPFMLLTLALSVLAGGSASRRPQVARWRVEVDTLPDGARHVVNTPPREPTPDWTLREELRIGSASDAGPTNFGLLAGLQVLGDGRIVVLDAMSKELRVFSPEGTPLATLGGEGQGPGEFQSPLGLMLDSQDRLWVPDYGAARISVFDPGGEFLNSFRMELRAVQLPWEGTITTDGRIVKPSVSADRPPRNVLRRWDTTMTEVRPLPMPTPSRGQADRAGYFRLGSSFIGVPFWAHAERLVDPRGGVWSTPDGDASYRIAYWEPGGDTALVVETHRPLVPVSTAQRDSALQSIRQGLKHQRGVSVHLDASQVPSVKPAVASMFLSEDGELWVRARTVDGRVLYDRYARDGTHLASVTSSSLHVVQQVTPVVRGDHLWAVVYDSMDVEYVVRMRMVRPGG